jgi:hypothetical protein
MIDTTSPRKEPLPFPAPTSPETTLWSLLYFVPALVTLFFPVLSDNDVWWHLRTGEWIFTNRAIPTHDLFSISFQNRPWTPYSWLFELIVYAAYKLAGLRGIIAFTSVMVLAVTLAIRSTVRRLMPTTASALALTTLAAITLAHLYTPRPWLFSILFFTIEAGILLKVIHHGPSWELAYLPPIFILWANIHIQFVDGLALLIIATSTTALLMLLKKPVPFPTRWLAVLTAICFAATFVTPYGWGLYRSAHDLINMPNAVNAITELESLHFRDIFDYSVLLFAIGAAICMAISKKTTLTEWAFYLFGVVYSFRSKRDIWIIVILSAAMIAQSLPTLSPRHKHRFQIHRIPLSCFGLVALFFFYLSPLVSDARTNRLLTSTFPAGAVTFIQAHNLPGPIFNTYDWGGYLMWNLRRPVSIDPRAGLYGDKVVMQNIYTWNAFPEWSEDSALKGADTIIAPRRAPLSQLLRVDADYKVLYEDSTAIIFGKAK